MNLDDVKTDCRYFKGNVPCFANKKYGVTCIECNQYDRFEEKILIIKLGAAGDVIRTTPLLYPLRKEYPSARIYWLTNYPRFVPVDSYPNADVVLDFNLQNVLYLKSMKFDRVINLDKDNEAIGLAAQIRSERNSGFIMRDGHCYPADELAEHKFFTGINDVYSKNNTKSYMEEMFEICGYEYSGENYVIDLFEHDNVDIPVAKEKKIIGLNTGSGERWVSRLWDDNNWIELANMLCDSNYEVILLGGESEHRRNVNLRDNSSAKYFGVFGLGNFINIVNKCDIIVSQVTMCMHIAIALKKKLVLMNNIFNKNEFELFGNGVIVEPEKECKCYFLSKCVNRDYHCMQHITPGMIHTECMKLLMVPENNNHLSY